MSSTELAPDSYLRPLSLASLAAITVALIGVALAGLGAARNHFLRDTAKPGLAEVRIGQRLIVAPAAAFAFGRPETARTERVDLALAWPGLAPATKVATDANGRPIASARAAVVLVSLVQADDGPDPSDRPVALHGRFLEPTVWNYPGDMVARRFRGETPYAGEELVFMPPDGREFWARCPLDVEGETQEARCVLAFRRRGLDVTVSFDRALLGEATVFREQLLTLFERMVR